MTSKKYNPIKISLGELVSSKRKSYGYSQEEFAFAIGISARSLSDIETGKSYPKLYTAAMISDVLNIDIVGFLYQESDSPFLLLNLYFNEFENAYTINNLTKLEDLLKSMDTIIPQIEKETIQYKKYLFSKARLYQKKRDIEKSLLYLKDAYAIKITNKSEELEMLDYRIYLLIQTLTPDLYVDDLGRLELEAIQSIINLKSTISNLDAYPDLKLKYLFNIMLIQLDNLEDYNSAKLTLNKVIDLARLNNNMNIVYKSYIYRAIIKYKSNDISYKNDIDEALEYFYITNQSLLFDAFIELIIEHGLVYIST